MDNQERLLKIRQAEALIAEVELSYPAGVNERTSLFLARTKMAWTEDKILRELGIRGN